MKANHETVEELTAVLYARLDAAKTIEKVSEAFSSYMKEVPAEKRKEAAMALDAMWSNFHAGCSRSCDQGTTKERMIAATRHYACDWACCLRMDWETEQTRPA